MPTAPLWMRKLKQLTKELDRIAKATSLTARIFLMVQLKKVELQVGTQAGQTIDLKLQAVDAKTLGMGSLTSDLMGMKLQQRLTLKYL